ncbi:MAG TPA: pilus assembly protein PilM, partial [bacterium]|nr:pilus assembly protein PilM [bacterium]
MRVRETKVIVDIGSDTIKVVEGAVNQRNFSISRIGVVKNPVANFRLGPVPEEQEVFISFLRDYLNRLNIRSRAGVSSVAGSEVLIHYFDIPEVPPEEVESMVEVELSEVFPQGWSSLEYDFQILPSSERKTVLLAGYPRSRCNFLMQVFSQCGLRLVILDLDSLALANLYSFTAQENGGSGLVINVGARLTNMALVEKGGFVLARDIAFGGQQVTEAISRRYQCPLSEAEKVKQKPDQAAAVSQIIREISADMTSEVNT